MDENENQNNQGNWSMPDPVFQASRGKTVHLPPKEMIEQSVPETTKLDENFPDLVQQPVELMPEITSDVQEQPMISDSFHLDEINVQIPPEPVQKGSSVIFWILGGTAIFFAFAAVFLAIVYLLFFSGKI